MRDGGVLSGRPPTLTKQEGLKAVSLVFILCLASYEPACSRSFMLNSSHLSWCSLRPGVHYGKRQAQLSSAFHQGCRPWPDPDFMALQPNAGASAPLLSRGSACPPAVGPCCEERDSRARLPSLSLSSSSPGKRSQQLALINSTSVSSKAIKIVNPSLPPF